MNELLWIALPAGLDGARCVLRVMVVAKLDGPTVQASGLDVWPPAALLDASASLLVEWREDEAAAALPTPVPAIDVRFGVQPGLWSKFFPPGMAVSADAPDGPAPTSPRVQPTSALAARVRSSYDAPADAPFDAHSTGRPDAYRASVLQGLAAWNDDDTGLPTAAPPPVVAPTTPAGSTFDDLSALLREHPAVMQALGLVFELRVSPPSTPPGLAIRGQVRVSWPGATTVAGLPTIASPWTRFDRAFLPASSTGQFSAGMLTLTADPAVPAVPDRPQWRVETTDVEGAVRRLRGAARIVAVDAAEAATSADSRVDVSLPALRSVGLQLLHVNRQGDMDARHGESLRNARRAAADLVLDAEHLVLGVRLDVRQDGGAWRSTHERTAHYTFDGADITAAAFAEEGHLKLRAFVEDPDGSRRATETVARWSGWSLSVPRPRLDGPVTSAASPKAGFGFGFAFAVPPGSLPRLRFTSQYAVRARAVDLSGHALGRDDPAAERCAIAQIGYGRHEPVLPPVMRLPAGVAPESLGPGESVDCLVIRSELPADATAFDAANPAYTTQATRLLARPPTTLNIAEQHDLLGDAMVRERSLAIVARAMAAGNARQRSSSSDTTLPDPAASGIQAVPLPGPAAPPAAFARQDWTQPWPETEAPKTLQLLPRQQGQTPVVWEGDTLVVRLAPAEQLMIEVSSTLTADMYDHFALRRDGSSTASKEGRNPMITPFRTLRFVHALRRPQWTPPASMRLDVQPRQPGQTFAVLAPFPAFLALQPNSTGQLDVSAQWIDRFDDSAPRSVTADVQSVRIDLGDTALQSPLVHEFGNTRHRQVTYTLAAVTRFRHYFHDADEAASADAFVVRQALSAPIPNTARPSPPVVQAVRPALEWDVSVATDGDATVFTRRRVGGLVRLEIQRPWYETGDGERLAVLLWGGDGAPSAGLIGHVTEIGRDPVWETTDVARWPAAASFHGLADPAVTLPLGPAGEPIVLLPFEPWFRGGRWYADVALPSASAASYGPMVRLAVARYQPASIDGCALSKIVATEFVALLPERICSVRQTADNVVVVLAGVGPDGPFTNRVDVILEHCDPPPGVTPESIELVDITAEGSAGNVWTPLDDRAVSGALGESLRLALPQGLSGRMRLRVREVERLAGAAPRTPGLAELQERAVFTQDVVLAKAP